MKWFYNLKIGGKILSIFVIMCFFFGSVGIYGVINYVDIKNANESTYTNYTVAISETSDIATDSLSINSLLSDIIKANDSESINAIEKQINGKHISINSNIKNINSKQLSSKAQVYYNKLIKSEKESYTIVNQITEYAKQNNDIAATNLLNNEKLTLTQNCENAKALKNVIKNDAYAKYSQKKTSSDRYVIKILILVTFLAAVGIVIGVLITRSITKPLKEATETIKKMNLHHFNNRLKYVYKDEIGEMSKAMNEFSEDLQNIIIDSMNKLSQGNADIDISPKDDEDELIPSLLRMKNSIQNLIDETKFLSREAKTGNLSARGDISKFSGEYINIVNAINGTLEAVVAPMMEVSRVMEELSVGNLKTGIEKEYQGDYAVLTNAVNKMVASLNSVLSQISVIIIKISEADLNINNIVSYDGDFNAVSVAFSKIVDSLNNIMKEINTAAYQVADGSRQIADTSVLLSQGSEEQASSIEQVTTVITNMASQVQQNAENANKADSLSKTAKENAIIGNDQMQKMIVAMSDINAASNNISKIINVIDEIAFQTNILALNAAVEAARAGQYGKGFAVVASEVRNLAQKSAAAANETTIMIESSIEKVKLGTDIANSTEGALEKIVDSVTKSSNLVGQIASSSNEQAIAIKKVNEAIGNVAGVIQTNTANAEETASASEELTSQAEMLKSMVNKFKLRDN